MSELSSVDIGHLRSWLDREDVAADTVSADLARKYHATFDLPGDPPVHGAAVPRLIHWCLAQPAAPTAALGHDGHPQRGGFLPPVSLPRRMWAGGALTFHGDLRVGDTVRRTSRIADVVLKEGRTGPLLFVTVEHRVEVQGTLVVEERQDIVYRGLDVPGGTPKALPPAASGADRRAMRAGPTLLFRYSALTFNGHRIHYDRRYATEAEGYPGLVVHGPLQAGLLLGYATELRGSPPRRFDFRGLAPLFDQDKFSLNADADGAGLKLWTAKDGGPICMAARATWS